MSEVLILFLAACGTALATGLVKDASERFRLPGLQRRGREVFRIHPTAERAGSPRPLPLAALGAHRVPRGLVASQPKTVSLKGARHADRQRASEIRGLERRAGAAGLAQANVVFDREPDVEALVDLFLALATPINREEDHVGVPQGPSFEAAIEDAVVGAMEPVAGHPGQVLGCVAIDEKKETKGLPEAAVDPADEDVGDAWGFAQVDVIRQSFDPGTRRRHAFRVGDRGEARFRAGAPRQLALDRDTRARH